MPDDEPHDDLPDPDHRTPAGVSDATVAALGKLSEALETCERARGHLYEFHQLTGSADIGLGEAIDALREAGHTDIAERLEHDLLGRNVLNGRWTFQVIEDYDDNYWSLFRDLGEVRPRPARRRSSAPVRGPAQAAGADGGPAGARSCAG